MTMHRRTVLRGIGASLALPFLPSHPLLAGEPAGTTGRPRRLVATFFGSGVMTEHWWAEGSGAAMRFGPCLEPLARLRDQALVIEGLRHAQCVQQVGDPHYSREPSAFCGVRAHNDPDRVRLAETFDQVVARHHETACPLSSLVMGGERPYGGVQPGGYSRIYGGHVSWTSPTTPVPKAVEPADAFARAFGDQAGMQRYTSVLDAVRGDAKRLAGELGIEDRRQLDEYQESIRGIERGIARRARLREERRHDPVACREEGAPRPPEEVGDLLERWELLLDVAVQALRCDRTRVVSFMFENCRSDVSFEPFVAGAGGHHGLSHKWAEKREQYTEVSRLHVEHLVRFAEKLAAVPDGDGTLLDHSMVVCVNGLYHGGAHNAHRLPVLLLGKGGGSIRPGRVLDYTAAKDRQLNRLYLSLMQRMGVEATAYEDGAEPLSELL